MTRPAYRQEDDINELQKPENQHPNNNGKWQAVNYRSTGEGFVFPIGDLREHDVTNKKCFCHPFFDEEFNMLIHNAADGRTAYERGERKPT